MIAQVLISKFSISDEYIKRLETMRFSGQLVLEHPAYTYNLMISYGISDKAFPNHFSFYISSYPKNSSLEFDYFYSSLEEVIELEDGIYKIGVDFRDTARQALGANDPTNPGIIMEDFLKSIGQEALFSGLDHIFVETNQGKRIISIVSNEDDRIYNLKIKTI